LEFGDIAARFEPPLDPEIGERLTIQLKVAGYVRRQEIAIERAAKTERTIIPADFDYADISALSREAREKLRAQRPRTLGAASRIPGVTPADVAIVGLFVERERTTRAS
jgi:tRNA uridine 5-carboxymethylaminomethyl modification enzyme